MKMIGAHIPDEMLDTLDQIAERRGVERTKIIRWALAEYIERELTPCPLEMTIVPSSGQAEPIAA